MNGTDQAFLSKRNGAHENLSYAAHKTNKNAPRPENLDSLVVTLTLKSRAHSNTAVGMGGNSACFPFPVSKDNLGWIALR